MAREPSGFGKPKLKRAEPQWIGTLTAAPEPLTGVREQVRCDNSVTENLWQRETLAAFGSLPQSGHRSRLGIVVPACAPPLTLGGG